MFMDLIGGLLQNWDGIRGREALFDLLTYTPNIDFSGKAFQMKQHPELLTKKISVLPTHF
jgi:hypothetical protein